MPRSAVTRPLSCCRSAGRKFPACSISPGRVLAWFAGRVFAEDCEIVEMEQAAYDAQGGDWNREVFPPIRELRRLLRECGEPGQ